METCHCGQVLIPLPVAGAVQFPKSLQCAEHGYPQERRGGMKFAADVEKPNDYETEIASAADARGNESYY